MTVEELNARHGTRFTLAGRYGGADWSIRHHGSDAGWEMVRYGLELARAFPSAA